MNDPLGNILNIRWPRMIKIEVVDGYNRDRIGCKNSRAIIENKRKKKKVIVKEGVRLYSCHVTMNEL